MCCSLGAAPAADRECHRLGRSSASSKRTGRALLVDEADTCLRDNEELRNVFNSGHRADGVVLRNVGDDHEPRQFSTYSASPSQRSASVARHHCRPLGRDRPQTPQTASEEITPFRIDRTGHLDVLARQIRAVGRRQCRAHRRSRTGNAGQASSIATADNWRPLLAIAEAAGGDWPERAREAAASAAAKMDERSRGIEVLLGDIRDVFAEEEEQGRAVDEIPSAALVEALIAIEGRPWAEYRQDRQTADSEQARPDAQATWDCTGADSGRRRDRVRGYRLKSVLRGLRSLPSRARALPNRHSRPKRDEQGTSDLFQTVHPRPAVTV